MKNIGEKINDILSVTGVFVILSGLGVVGYQAYFWLKEGSWKQISLIDTGLKLYSCDFLSYNISDECGWLLFGQEWTGVHKILEHFPLSLVLVLTGLLLIFIPFNELFE